MAPFNEAQPCGPGEAVARQFLDARLSPPSTKPSLAGRVKRPCGCRHRARRTAFNEAQPCGPGEATRRQRAGTTTPPFNEAQPCGPGEAAHAHSVIAHVNPSTKPSLAGRVKRRVPGSRTVHHRPSTKPSLAGRVKPRGAKSAGRQDFQGLGREPCFELASCSAAHGLRLCKCFTRQHFRCARTPLQAGRRRGFAQRGGRSRTCRRW